MAEHEDLDLELALSVPMGGEPDELPCEMWGREGSDDVQAEQDILFLMAATGELGDKDEALEKIKRWDDLSDADKDNMCVHQVSKSMDRHLQAIESLKADIAAEEAADRRPEAADPETMVAEAEEGAKTTRHRPSFMGRLKRAT